MKRVYTLYRVSTKQQVDHEHDDIPMQKTACREFAAKQDWTIVKEFEEKGISGFKVSANDRDAIQDLKAAALKGEFEVLLVFMFDRIGRIDDETPFVVEWFVKHGIEVWSVREGEQRFENHVDKLTNYIRFWQASGESEKTSMRIKTRMQQLTLEGHYTGGNVPYGYQLVDKGRKNKRGNPLYDLAIEPVEAETVRQIFMRTVNEGLGSYRLAEALNKQGLRVHSGNAFRSLTIQRILRNSIYCGHLAAGEVVSPLMPELKIIEQSVFDDAQEILDQRAKADDEKRHIALSTKGKAMLSGNIFCAHCGSRLVTIRYRDRYHKKDGTEVVVDQVKYACYHKSRGLCECDGQTTYIADRIDAAVCDVMRELFRNMKGAPHEDYIRRALMRERAVNQASQKKARLDLSKAMSQLEKLQAEIGKALVGESVYAADDLAQSIKRAKEKIGECEAILKSVQRNESERIKQLEMIGPSYAKFQSWADEFDNATLEQRKMIACQLFTRIDIGRDYKIRFEVNMTYKQFCTEWTHEAEEVS